LVNFAHASYKKVRDVAVSLMQRRYGEAPKKLYFFGSSEGGREGITMAQRYPADFDGIFSRVPVINWVALQVAGTRAGIAQFGDGWLAPEKVKLVHDAVPPPATRDGLAGRHRRRLRGLHARVRRHAAPYCAPAASCLTDPEGRQRPCTRR
jgi:feruloyl esterase